MESNSVCNHTGDKQNRMTAKRESDLLITSMITDWIGRHEVLLLINHKNYSFREKEDQLSYEKGENLHWNTGKGGVNMPAKVTGKNTKANARARTRNYNFECDWLI